MQAVENKTVDASPVMSVRECADFLRATRSAVFAFIHSGALPFQQIGRRFVVPRQSVEELVASRWQRIECSSKEAQKSQ